ncbi:MULTISPECIES: hypothetical protein [Enterococcus]|uniref:DUF1129 family protein n=1 Tax=Enterococcus entomosocium TaxID=3034352 RepID=A0ABV3MG15_9ENTE|nr:hypothetical protein [Enterococcus casseliflavus]MBV6371400.1 hypothetical protein [Enterococcus casseliflavus]MBX9116883.1 hypothetical protein [Enterococcus casseliflavus]MBX9127205.1 hypothetical protein [Enterococcus casseliflavus]MDB1707979.1 hypothetical protein [Enterococcus casseliflavus]MDB1716776.1 hypothetical protein [Enterococcus casseliflavus]
MVNKQETTYWREQTNLIEQQFNEKNRQFFDDFRSYLLLSSLFYDEHKVTEQVYAIAMDLLEAQTHGEEAQHYFGNDPKGVADELLANTPKSNLKERLKLAYLAIGISWGIKFIADFTNQGPLVLNLLAYVLTGLVTVLAVIGIFSVISKTIYQKKGTKKAFCFGSLWLVMSGWIGLSLLINLLTPNWWLLTIAFPFDVVLVGSLLVAAIVFVVFRKEKAFYPIAFLLGVFVLLGCLQKALVFYHIGERSWMTGGFLTLLVVGFLIFLWWTRRVMKEQ